jgi:exopolyphosphatase/guanosine-5'-triphosphate,3'-diphosphate pyrophosphatase
MNVAAIDIGTNSIRLLVVEVPERLGRLNPLLRLGEPCRLGRGLSEAGAIDAEILERACGLVADMAERARRLGAANVVVAATEALRATSNQVDVLKRLESAAGVPVRVLTGHEEASLVYAAVVESLGRRGTLAPIVVFDIGGGSTEVASGAGPTVGRTASLTIGAVSLTERFLKSDPPAESEVGALDAEIKIHIMNNCALLPHVPAVFAGVGGTMTILASIFLDLPHYDPARIDGCTIPVPAVAGMVERLTWMTQRERREVPVMGAGRADIVVAGSRVVLGLARFFEASAVVASSQGLRYALARVAATEAPWSEAG